MLRNGLFALAILLVGGLSVVAAEPKMSALIIDGQNNHRWQQTTPLLKKALESSGLFSVEVATAPRGNHLADFAPEFSKFDVVVSNYNGALWSDKTQKAFIDYVKGGGGFVVVHAANNSFGKWREYNEIIGLGGWGGRSEKSGPYIYFQDGKIVRDTSKGRGGSHGRRHPFQVVVRNSDHPVTKGMPSTWLHAADELYDRLRGPAENMTVLATAYSEPKTGGRGKHEPMIFTISYGKGRVFHTPMGHDAHAMKCAGFIATIQRGSEWAATGKVTQALPKDFPTDSVTLRE